MTEVLYEASERKTAPNNDLLAYERLVAEQLTHTIDVYGGQSIIMKPAELLSYIDFKQGAIAVDLSLEVGKHNRHLHSDDKSGTRRSISAVQQLQALSLTKAKLLYAEKYFPDHPALRGIASGIDAKIAVLSTAIVKTGFTTQELAAKVKKVGRFAIAILGFAVAACQAKFGAQTGEIPTPLPTQAGEVQHAESVSAAQLNDYVKGVLGEQVAISLAQDKKDTHRLMGVEADSAEAVLDDNGKPIVLHFSSSNGASSDLALCQATLQGDEEETTSYFFVDVGNGELGNVYLIFVTQVAGSGQITGNLIPNSKMGEDDAAIAFFEQHRIPDQNYAPYSFSLTPKGEGVFEFIINANGVQLRVTLTEAESAGVAHLAALTPYLTPAAPSLDAQSDEPPPTPEAIQFQREVPASMDQFTDVGSERAIFEKVYPALRATLEPFGEDVKPVDAQIITNQDGSPIQVVLVCNEGSINCVPVAWVKYSERGDTYYIVVFAIKNADSSTGFFPFIVSGGSNFPQRLEKIYSRIARSPTGTRRIRIEISDEGPNVHDGHPIFVEFAHDPAAVEAMLKFADENIFPEGFEEIIPGNTIN